MKELSYTKHGDYYFPDLTLPKQPDVPLGRYARLHLEYLKKHRKVTYLTLLTSCKLTQHLLEIQEAALARKSHIIEEMKKSQNITETLKSQDQMKWVGLMNAVTNTAEEIVLTELIYT